MICESSIITPYPICISHWDISTIASFGDDFGIVVQLARKKNTIEKMRRKYFIFIHTIEKMPRSVKWKERILYIQ